MRFNEAYRGDLSLIDERNNSYETLCDKDNNTLLNITHINSSTIWASKQNC